MLEIKDLSKSLGLSDKQVRRRLNALDGIIDKHIKRGENNKLLFDSGGLEILRRMEQYREDHGKTIQDAAEEIQNELGESPHRETSGNGDYSHNYEALKVENVQLKARIQDLKEQVIYLREQNQRLLPSGEKKSWWQFWN